MLAEFEARLAGAPWRYRELFWEAGVVGQVLYLEQARPHPRDDLYQKHCVVGMGWVAFCSVSV